MKITHIQGHYKITRNVPPVGDGKWRLFNLANDPGGSIDLSTEEPDIFNDLPTEYDNYAAAMGVLDMSEGYDSVQRILENTMDRLFENYPWLYAVLAAIVLAFWLIMWLLARSVIRLVKPAE